MPSRPDLGDDDLAATRRKDLKELVATFDKLIRPLDEILRLMKNAWRGGVILLAFMALMVGVQVHTTLRMVAVEERLNDVIGSQKVLAAAATAQEQQQAQQSQITIEPAVTPSGAPTAIIVIKPPQGLTSSSKPARPVPLALAPTATAATSVSGAVPKPSSGAPDAAPPAPAPPAALTVKFE